jgi:hypothetical protein
MRACRSLRCTQRRYTESVRSAPAPALLPRPLPRWPPRRRTQKRAGARSAARPLRSARGGHLGLVDLLEHPVLARPLEHQEVVPLPYTTLPNPRSFTPRRGRAGRHYAAPKRLQWRGQARPGGPHLTKPILGHSLLSAEAQLEDVVLLSKVPRSPAESVSVAHGQSC